MNLEQLKKWAYKELNDPWNENKLDTILNKFVDEIEKAVVPERIGLESLDIDIPILEQSGWNKCVKEVQTAFTRFKGESHEEMMIDAIARSYPEPL